MPSRRDWLKTSSLALAGLPLLSTAARATQSQQAKHLLALNQSAEGEAYWELVKAQFRFADGLHYFNNGSLGPSPDYVRQATTEFRSLLDEFPSKYMWGAWQESLEGVREQAGTLFGASTEEIALVHNTTEGMNVIAASLDLRPNDEVILCDHEHTSAFIPWKYHQESKGIKLVRPTLPLMPTDADAVVEVFRKAITPRTRVISLVHVTNTNGMILPVKEITEMAHARGILVAVDGAQALGAIPVDLHDLGCDFYANSAHKWLFAPKGTGLLYARAEEQHRLKALVVCRGYDDPSIRRLENYNTRNLPDVLGMGAALDYHRLLGPTAKTERLYQLKHALYERMAERPYLKGKTPTDDRLSGSIQTVEVLGKEVRAVGSQLQEEFGINVRSMTGFGLNGLRISLSVFNTLADVDYLIAALDAIAEG